MDTTALPRMAEEQLAMGVGDLLVIPPHRHDLQALGDAAVLLTVASRA